MLGRRVRRKALSFEIHYAMLKTGERQRLPARILFFWLILTKRRARLKCMDYILRIIFKHSDSLKRKFQHIETPVDLPGKKAECKMS